MENKNTLFIIIMALVCMFSIFFAVLLFRHAKKIEFEFKEREAGLIRESMDLQDGLAEMEEKLNAKIKEVDAAKKEKESALARLESLEKKSEETEKMYAGKVEALEKESEKLKGELKRLQEIPAIELIKKAKDIEKDENIKKMLERILRNIELVRKGGIVDLEPIVVAEGTAADEALATDEKVALLTQKRVGEVLSIDRANNLIVINLGSADGIREGVGLTILDGEEEIASGEIISLRHKISAAFIDDIEYKRTIRDIKDGYKVLIGK